MKSNIIFLFTFLFSIFSYAQVGVNTDSPQKTLHVNGSLQLTNELNVGGDGTTAGNPGTKGQILHSNGPDSAPYWGDDEDPEIQTIQYKRKVVSPISSTTPDDSVVELGNLAIRYNGKIPDESGYIEYKVTKPTYVTSWYSKKGAQSGGTSSAEIYRAASVEADTWTQLGTNMASYNYDISPKNRDLSFTIITLHGSNEVYRVTSNVNGKMAATGNFEAVDSSVTLFLEKLE